MYAVYNFDDAERLANIVNSSDSSTTTFGYDNEDKVISRAYPNGVTTAYQYFDNDLLKRITDTNSSTTLFDRQYFYNSAAQISQIIEPGRSRTFGYDNTDRLTSVTDATYGNESYSFDDVGNRLSSHRASAYGYQAGQFNRLISATTPAETVTYSHDANGNTTTKSEGKNFWRYTWDYENRMAEASTRKEKVRYKFDALGRRVQRFVVGGRENTKFIHDGLDVLVDDNAGTLTKYLNGEGIDNKLRQTTGSNTSYFLADHLGSTNGLADTSGAITSQTTYDSFGNSTNASFPSRYQFTGREYDSHSQLHYYRARWYDANLGRFISEDPIGFRGGDINLYGYVWNNPQQWRDASGHGPLIVLGVLWGVAELGGTAYDIYDLGSSLTDPCSSWDDIGVGAGGLAIGAVAAGSGYGRMLKSFRKKGKPVFPDNPDDLLPDLPRDAKGRIFPSDYIRIRPEKHPIKPGETYSARHHGQHYHVDYRTDATKSWNNKKNTRKVKPRGYKKGAGTGFLPGEEFP